MFPRNTSLATFLVILSTMSICWTVADALYIVKNREMMAEKKSSDEYGQDAIKEAAILQQQKVILKKKISFRNEISNLRWNKFSRIFRLKRI